MIYYVRSQQIIIKNFLYVIETDRKYFSYFFKDASKVNTYCTECDYCFFCCYCCCFFCGGGGDVVVYTIYYYVILMLTWWSEF